MRQVLFILATILACASGFLPVPSALSQHHAVCGARRQFPMNVRTQPAPLRPKGTGVMPLYGIFGLGTPELVVIALVAGFVLGPDKIVDLARGVGKAAGELKSVPQEFEKGLQSGEDAALKAKAEVAARKEREKAKTDA